MSLNKQEGQDWFLSKWFKNTGRDKRWRTLEQANFFDSLANLLKMGFQLTRALEFIAETDKQLAAGVIQLNNRLATGDSFSASAQALIDVQSYYQLLIAEKHGQLSDVLEELAKFDRLKMKQMKKIKTMLVYPLFLCFILIVLIVMIHVYVFPQIEALMPSVNTTKPDYLGMTLVNVVLGGTVLTLAGSFLYWRRQTILKRTQMIVRVPIIGTLYQKYIAYYLASNLATLLRNGLSVQEIYQTLNAFNSHSLLYALGQQLNEALIDGQSIKQMIARYRFIPQEIIKFMGSGNTIAEMANSMSAYSKLMFDDMILTTNKMIGFIQPAMFILIGITIVSTYFQLLIPIYSSVKGMY
ncbi:type II secretion system F family protein [Lentilactobacillus kisonensis]|uniref:Bacterial type II secretion system protein F domain protein n=1 Tax=Lentilactobacillus kisonensis F0435 TaxID=797516 RepID=H1LJK6_9LACO|nr:type II secretion system F family protein [Lentilactobacillus kisonensis]EHO48578.1 bacterial type II secretion system protein F domain protein [Lentilactobacillus kisonensis F0435]